MIQAPALPSPPNLSPCWEWAGCLRVESRVDTLRGAASGDTGAPSRGTGPCQLLPRRMRSQDRAGGYVFGCMCEDALSLFGASD